MKITLVILSLIFIDGKKFHEEETFSFVMHHSVTLEHCKKYLAPAFTRIVEVDEGFVSKSIAKCEAKTRAK